MSAARHDVANNEQSNARFTSQDCQCLKVFCLLSVLCFLQTEVANHPSGGGSTLSNLHLISSCIILQRPTLLHYLQFCCVRLLVSGSRQ